MHKNILDEATKHWPIVICGVIILLVLCSHFINYRRSANEVGQLCSDANMVAMVDKEVSDKLESDNGKANLAIGIGDFAWHYFRPNDRHPGRTNSSHNLVEKRFLGTEGDTIQCETDVAYNIWIENEDGTNSSPSRYEKTIRYTLTPSTEGRYFVNVEGLDKL